MRPGSNPRTISRTPFWAGTIPSHTRHKTSKVANSVGLSLARRHFMLTAPEERFVTFDIFCYKHFCSFLIAGRCSVDLVIKTAPISARRRTRSSTGWRCRVQITIADSSSLCPRVLPARREYHRRTHRRHIPRPSITPTRRVESSKAAPMSTKVAHAISRRSTSSATAVAKVVAAPVTETSGSRR